MGDQNLKMNFSNYENLADDGASQGSLSAVALSLAPEGSYKREVNEHDCMNHCMAPNVNPAFPEYGPEVETYGNEGETETQDDGMPWYVILIIALVVFLMFATIARFYQCYVRRKVDRECNNKGLTTWDRKVSETRERFRGYLQENRVLDAFETNVMSRGDELYWWSKFEEVERRRIDSILN